MDIKPKVTLKKKGSTSSIGLDNFQATLRWKTSVDADLHCIYETKDGKIGEVYYGRKAHSGEGFKIILDEDAGVGNSIGSQGFNEENIRFEDTTNLKRATLFTNIFGGAQNYASIGAHILVGKDNRNTAPEVEVDLTSTSRSKIYQVAEIDFSGFSPVIKSLDFVSNNKPNYSESRSTQPRTGGILGRIFG